MSTDFGEHVIATVESSKDPREQIANRARVMLDQIVDRIQTAGGMPYGMVLEGRITLDWHGNRGLYVFLKMGDETFTGRSGVGNEGPRIEAVKGGRWISLNKDDFSPEWEAREIRDAIKNYRREHGVEARQASRITSEIKE